MQALMRRSSLDSPIRRAKGARGDGVVPFQLPRLELPPERSIQEEPDALTREYNRALDIGDAVRYWIDKQWTKSPTKDFLLEPALDLYTANREYGNALRRMFDVLEGRQAEARAGNGTPPALSDRARASLAEAAKTMGQAMRAADAFRDAAYHEDRANLATARAEAEWWSQPWYVRVRDQVVGGAPVAGDAAVAIARELGEAVGEGVRKAVEKSYPWGPIILGVIGIVGLAVLFRR